MTDASGMSPKGEKRKEQTFGTEIDMKGLNDAYASIMQSRYESSRQPPMIDYIVANRRRNDYYQNVLGKEMYNNMYGGGSGGYLFSRKKPGVIGRLGSALIFNYIDDNGDVKTGIHWIDPSIEYMTKDEADAIPDEEYTSPAYSYGDLSSEDYYHKDITKMRQRILSSDIEDYSITGRPDDEADIIGEIAVIGSKYVDNNKVKKFTKSTGKFLKGVSNIILGYIIYSDYKSYQQGDLDKTTLYLNYFNYGSSFAAGCYNPFLGFGWGMTLDLIVYPALKQFSNEAAIWINGYINNFLQNNAKK